MPATIYYQDDADLSKLDGKTVGIVGFGSQGHAQAMNLRDSGVNVIVNTREGSANWKFAIEHGFEPESDPRGPQTEERATCPECARRYHKRGDTVTLL